MIKYALSILFLSYILCTSNEMKKLSIKDITKYHKTDTTLLMMYLNPLNFTHKAMLDTFQQIQLSYPNYTYGYVDAVSDQNILHFFKLKDLNDTGLVIYRFYDEHFYYEENIHNATQIIDFITQVENGTVNWYSNSLIERIFEIVTGKRYGKKAHTYFSFAVCIVSIIVYTAVNIWAKREERKEIEKRFKKD